MPRVLLRAYNSDLGSGSWGGSLPSPMTLRAKAVSSMPFVNGCGITVVQDHRSHWRLGDIHRGLATVAIEISPDDWRRGFESPEAVADHFRQRYGNKLLAE